MGRASGLPDGFQTVLGSKRGQIIIWPNWANSDKEAITAFGEKRGYLGENLRCQVSHTKEGAPFFGLAFNNIVVAVSKAWDLYSDQYLINGDLHDPQAKEACRLVICEAQNPARNKPYLDTVSEDDLVEYKKLLQEGLSDWLKHQRQLRDKILADNPGVIVRPTPKLLR